MRNLKKGQHIFIAFQNGKAVLDSQLRPRMYTSLENADRWTPTVNKGKIEYVEYAPTLTPPNEPLTLDELREMNGEPVWVIYDQDAANTTPGFAPLAFWALVEVAKNSVFLVNNFGGRTAYADDQDLDWEGITVYRRPPEGEGERLTQKFDSGVWGIRGSIDDMEEVGSNS